MGSVLYFIDQFFQDVFQEEYCGCVVLGVLYFGQVVICLVYDCQCVFQICVFLYWYYVVDVFGWDGFDYFDFCIWFFGCLEDVFQVYVVDWCGIFVYDYVV